MAARVTSMMLNHPMVFMDNLDLLSQHRFHGWKNGMQSKGLRVNMHKTEIMALKEEEARY